MSILTSCKADNEITYNKAESYHSDFIIADGKWISKEYITLTNKTSADYSFEIYAYFEDDYKNGFIPENKLKGATDETGQFTVYNIKGNETKTYEVYFICKSNGHHKKTSRQSVRKIFIDYTQ